MTPLIRLLTVSALASCVLGHPDRLLAQTEPPPTPAASPPAATTRAAAQAGATPGFHEVVRKALEYSPFMVEARHKLGFRQAQLAEARHAHVLPKFEANYLLAPAPDLKVPADLEVPAGLEPIEEELEALAAKTGRFEDLEFGPSHIVEVTATQPLFTFGRLKGLRDQAEAGTRAAEAEIRDVEREIRWRVAQIYFGLLLARQSTFIVEETALELERVRSRVEKLAERGEISQEDRQRLRLFEVELENRRAEAGLNVSLALRALKIAAGEDLDIGSDFPETEIAVPAMETLVASARQGRPDLQRVDYGIRARAGELAEARSAFFPQLFVFARFNFASSPGRVLALENPFIGDPLNTQRFTGAVGVNQNLNFLITHDRVSQAGAERAGLEAKRSGLQDLVEGEVIRAYFEYEEARTKKTNNAQAVRIARGWLSTAVSNYTLGLISMRDVLDSFQAYLEAKKDFAESLHAYYTSLAGLDHVAQTSLLSAL
ncbi:MAG: TolC family protein [Nitrospirae bacterium]|nr:TolC family protein [Nitrospirota bacterium]